MARGLGAVLFTATLVAVPARAQLVADPPAEPPAAEPELDPRVEEARALFQQGVELSRQDRWGEALEYFRRSLAIVERPNTIFNIAGIYVRLGRGTEAVVAYRRYLELAPPDDPDRAAAERALVVAEASIAQLELEVYPADAVVRIDGRRVDGATRIRRLELDPGQRVLTIAAPGRLTQTIYVSALPGDRGSQRIVLEEDAANIAPAARAMELRIDETAGHWLLAWGAGVAAAGAILLGTGLADRAAVESADGYWSDVEGAYERAVALTPAGAIALGVGFALAGLGVGWLMGVRVGVAIEDRSAVAVVGGALP